MVLRANIGKLFYIELLKHYFLIIFYVKGKIIL